MPPTRLELKTEEGHSIVFSEWRPDKQTVRISRGNGSSISARLSTEAVHKLRHYLNECREPDSLRPAALYYNSTHGWHWVTGPGVVYSGFTTREDALGHLTARHYYVQGEQTDADL